jgi:hypothetical protein
LRADKEVVLAAVRKSGYSGVHAAVCVGRVLRPMPHARIPPTKCTKMHVRQFALALQYASPVLRADKEVVLTESGAQRFKTHEWIESIAAVISLAHDMSVLLGEHGCNTVTPTSE